VIETRKLKFQTNPIITDTNMIIYSLLEEPKFGYIYLDYERLRMGQIFSQQDIDRNRLRYRLFRHAFSFIDDAIKFKVIVPQCSDVTALLKFHYSSSKSSSLSDTVENIHVIEGHQIPLQISQTNYRDFGVTSLSFNLTEKPRHGSIMVYNDSLPIRINTTYFTSDELTTQSVFYVHDDTETTNDAFEFLAISFDETDFMYIGKFYVEIDLKNDNRPARINRKILQVVSRAEKLITKANLLYTDKDLNTKSSDLVYTVKQISNGELYKVNEPQYQIKQFTQQDIDSEKIIYKHRGSKYERIDFTITDGELFTNGELEIQAGQAYVKLLFQNEVVVQSNRSVFLSLKDIDIETNLYINFTEIDFNILEKPKYGFLLKYNKETSSFTGEDLIRKTIVYKHLGMSLKKEQLKIKVTVRGVEDSGFFTIKAFPESYWEPLIVQNNNTVYVVEATSVILNRKSLEISHSDIPASKITYYIKEWPKHGYLEVQTYEDNGDEEEDEFGTHLVKHFEQNLVIEGRVYYVQTTPNQTHDKFVVDVTNSITWLRNLSVNIIIIPDKVYVSARNLTVLEGKSIILHDSDFYAITPYFAGKITDYRLITKPHHGSIIDTRNNPTRKFSQKQLSVREISYKNSGDELSIDYFKMIAIAGEKNSEPFDVWINVVPINDEVPVVLNMTKFRIWQGGSIIVTNQELATVDNDTLPSDLVYNINNIMNGYFSLSESSRVEIFNFTQEMINAFKILFTHTS
jgi:chondroitin sulfate proteoglycan 4